MTTAAVLSRLSRLEVLAQALAGAVQVPDAVQLMRQAGMEPDPWQAAVLQSSEPRILLNCCRQSGKSVVAAALALGTALAEPGALVLVLSPSLRQSQESFRKVLDLYRTIHTAIPTRAESALRMELGNGSRIISLPGTEATVRGYSQVRLLVVDEASRVLDPLYYAIRPMLSVSQGRLIALSTPFGARGWWYQEWTEGAGWERVRITAEQCPRISPPFLEEERRTLPPLWFQSEYECRFVDTVDQVFSTELLLRAMKDDIDPLWADEDDPWALSSA
jgi:Terminase large subunit, T4likevirus-type, N-terminal